MSTATTDSGIGASGDATAATETSAEPEGARPEPRSVAIRLSTMIVGLAVTALLAGTCVFAGLYWSTDSDLASRTARAADDKHAQQVAGDYAIGASTIDYHDTSAWFDRLKVGTTPQLAAKFDATRPQLEQILLPLQWTSTATPIASVVTSEKGGVYKVSTFLDVNSTSAQTPQGTSATVTYALTIDKNSGWKITDVGGLEGALQPK